MPFWLKPPPPPVFDALLQKVMAFPGDTVFQFHIPVVGISYES
jgi:hypothetical protein